MILAGRDRYHVGQNADAPGTLHLYRGTHRRVAQSPAQLAEAVVAPSHHGPIALERQAVKLARCHRHYAGQHTRAAHSGNLNRRLEARICRGVADFTNRVMSPSHQRAIAANRQAVVRAGRNRHHIRKNANAADRFHEHAFGARQRIAKGLKSRAVAELAGVVEPPRYHRSVRQQLKAEPRSAGHRHGLQAVIGRHRAVLRHQCGPIAQLARIVGTPGQHLPHRSPRPRMLLPRRRNPGNPLRLDRRHRRHCE